MNKIIFHPITALFLTVIAATFAVSLQKTRQKSEGVAQTANQLKSQVDQLKLELKQVENSLNQDNLSLEQEKVIRNELLMKKEGETIFQLPSISPTEEVVIGQTQAVKPIEAWKQLIFR